MPAGFLSSPLCPAGLFEKTKALSASISAIATAGPLRPRCGWFPGRCILASAAAKAPAKHGLLLCAVKWAASIDLKKEEEGLLSFCKEQGLPLQFYSAEQLLQVPGDFTPSEFVQKITGVDNVCERAALLGAEQLIVKKTAKNGVTVAVAAERTEVSFE